MATTPPRFTDLVPCGGCGRSVYHPLWRHIGDGEYIGLCEPCRARLDATFTAEQAINQALIICGIHQGKLRSAGVK